uniref:G-protein coupled receptors family 1 profile domain-containing protein n=1 Tax=Strigamia maritima TaxID=126957 RepID=T1IYK1_STRMM
MENATCPPPFDIFYFNFSDFEYPGPPNVMRPFTWREVLKVIAYVVVFLLAVGGNTLVMLIVYFNQQLRTTTNFYLVNLAVADVMIAVCCMWVHLVKHLTSPIFLLGAFMCKVDAFIQSK